MANTYIYREFVQRTVLVTGGARGIGAAVAQRFVDLGANVVVADLQDPHPAGSLGRDTAQGDSKFMFIAADVSKDEDCRNVVEKTQQAFGRIDVLFNNAGITRRASVVETTEEEWDRVLDTNLKSVFLLSKRVVPVMIANGGGAIVNTASGWGLVGGANAASYCASKGGVVLLTKAMAVDHGKHNIRVNCICPGDVRTQMLIDESRQLGLAETKLVENGVNRPLGRVGEPDEIAAAVIYLASSMASFVTGTALVVDGGGLAGSQ